MNFYKRHLGDIAKATGHLSQGEMGAYDLLLDWCYSNEKPLPLRADDVYRIGRGFTKPERLNIDRVLQDFFDRSDSGYTQKRVLVEMANAHAQAETNRRIAAEREANKRAANAARTEHESLNDSLDEQSTNRSTNDQPSQNPDSRQEQKQKPKHAHPGKRDERFGKFWDVYPRKVAKEAARKVFVRIDPDDSLLETMIRAVKRQRCSEAWKKDDGQFVPYPATWLNAGRWLDEEESAGAETTPNYMVGAI